MQTDNTPRARRSGSEGIQPYPLEFSGSGGEYFRVWIVNVLLSVVTLGFYTPFARRRTAMYFYGHTVVAGSPLEFTAPKRKMFVGFMLLVVLYAAFKLAAETGQDLAVSLFMLGGAALAPYFWGSAMRFRMSSTRWRGVRPHFAATWAEVYKASWPVFAVALIWAAVSMVAGMLVDMPAVPAAKGKGPALPTIPLTVWLMFAGALVATLLCVIRLEFNYKSLQVSRARIGVQAGRWKPAYGDFVRIWLATLGVFFACILVVSLALGVLVGGSFAMLKAMGERGGLMAVMLVVAAVIAFMAIAFFSSAPARAYREARMFQLVWSNVGVSHIARFKCKLKARRYVMLRLKNMFLSLLTLGFYRPFALVSEYRMKTESVTLHVKGGLDQLVGQLVRQQDGVGDAIADAVGLDLVG
jgi:uncharacterized membrane protein YjgN (DUF898 family)